MKTVQLPIIDKSVLSKDTAQFWMGDLNDLQKKIPNIDIPHIHGICSILFLEKAEGEINLEQLKIRTIQEPSTIIIKPGNLCSLKFEDNSIGKIICFSEEFFSGGYNNNFLIQFSFFKREAKACITFTEQEYKRWLNLFSIMYEEFLADKKGCANVLRSFTTILFFELERMFKPEHTNYGLNFRAEKINQLEKLVNEFYCRHKLPSYYAAELNMSTNHLNRLCKEERGITAGEIIRDRIAIEAKRLLHFTNLTVNEIAYQLGFVSASYFVTFFKKETSCTPEQFRKKLWSEK